jgi:hypothetical protein
VIASQETAEQKNEKDIPLLYLNLTSKASKYMSTAVIKEAKIKAYLK